MPKIAGCPVRDGFFEGSKSISEENCEESKQWVGYLQDHGDLKRFRYGLVFTHGEYKRFILHVPNLDLDRDVVFKEGDYTQPAIQIGLWAKSESAAIALIDQKKKVTTEWKEYLSVGFTENPGFSFNPSSAKPVSPRSDVAIVTVWIFLPKGDSMQFWVNGKAYLSGTVVTPKYIEEDGKVLVKE